MPEILNKSGQMNYVAGNKVFILDELKKTTTAELLGNMSASCAGILAVRGTPNFRIMYDASYHIIHFGQSRMIAERNNEIETAARNAKHVREKIRKIYLDHTKINPKTLKRYYEVEGSGQLFPQECLKVGVCDWIVSPKGIFIKNKSR